MRYLRRGERKKDVGSSSGTQAEGSYPRDVRSVRSGGLEPAALGDPIRGGKG